MVGPAGYDLAEARSEGFSLVGAEMVARLLDLLRQLEARRETAGQFTLKGGTALNVFRPTRIPRLSVDIDLMATGEPGAPRPPAPPPHLVDAVEDVARRLGYRVRRNPSPAACTLRLAYRNQLGSPDQIHLDLDLLNRTTLLPAHTREGPALFHADDLHYPVVADAELLGQKLTAVAYRAAARDLFDMHGMLRERWHLKPRARASYLAYSFLSDHEWYRLSYPTRLAVEYRPAELEDLLRAGESVPTLNEIRAAATHALDGVHPPFTAATDEEQELRSRLLAGDCSAFADLAGEVMPSRRRALARHPGLLWRLRQAGRSASPREELSRPGPSPRGPG